MRSLHPSLSQIGGLQPAPKTSIAVTSGTGKAVDFKFSQYIPRVHPKSPLKSLQKRDSGRIQGLPKFFGYPLLSQECVHLQTLNFARTFTGSIRQKPIKYFGKSICGHSQTR